MIDLVTAHPELKPYLLGNNGFNGSCSDYASAQAVILGLPMDYTVSFRPGARLGPERIREVSYGLELYSWHLDRTLADYKYYDAGDLNLPFGNVQASLAVITKAVDTVVQDGRLPICLGGEHLVSWGVFQGVYAHYPDLVVVHFDAHADLRTEFVGETDSHATVVGNIARTLGPKRVYQLGIRSGEREELEFAREYTHLYSERIFPGLEEVIPQLAGKPVYVTLDIDVVDPAFAPGTGTPEPGGCTSAEILRAVHMLGDVNVVAFDLVEVAPQLESSDITPLLGAKIVREALLSFLK
ncbi:MAG: agmatinase [Firmicutes bacterium]|nr:agmatinase [Bacillota bacterium]